MSPRTGNVYEAYRLYSDVQDAFTEELKPNSDDGYTVLSAAIPGAQSQTIGALPDCTTPRQQQSPLAGVKLGVKDIYDIAGI